MSKMQWLAVEWGVPAEAFILEREMFPWRTASQFVLLQSNPTENVHFKV